MASASGFPQLTSGHFLAEVPRWMVHKRVAPFNRRVTALAWHPTLMDVVAVGSHGGDILQWDLSDASRNIFLHGVSDWEGYFTAW